jgi:NodT family efflux transporter outer membrane factor (OMF) lipoprotein
MPRKYRNGVRQSLQLAWAAGILAVLTGCASFSGITPSARPIEPGSLGLAAATPALPDNAEETPSFWWRAFGDEQLNGLVDQALAKNPGLRAASARLQRMQAASDLTHASGQPQLNASLDATRQRYSANGLFPPPIAGANLDSATLQANASWELDFFGKNGAALQAALGQVRAAEADAKAARGLLASQVARTYFQWVRLETQFALAERTLHQREAIHSLVVERVNAGLDTRLELEQSEATLPEARLQIEILKEQQGLAVNALAALCAIATKDISLKAPERGAIPAPVATAVPLDLLGRRSDVAAARWRVQAAAREIDSAKALFYPNINLVAFAGFSSIGFDKLLTSDSDQWGVGPAIRLPLFDAGRLRANLRGKTAELDSAVESYNTVVLEAVHEVADHISSAQAIARQTAQQQEALGSAEAAWAIAKERYGAGLGNYLAVLSAETAVLAQRRQGADLVARARDNRVQLMHALGGDYANEQLATATANPP